MKKYVTLIIGMVLIIGAVAQQPSEAFIKSSRDYYYGTGVSFDEQQAREEAITEISEMIAVRVAGKMEIIAKEDDGGYTEIATSVINTYSTATLRNVESILTVMPDGKVQVFCYISKGNVQKLYDQRKVLVYDMYRNGEMNELKGNLAFALKNYYFGNILLGSIPDENTDVYGTNLTLKIPGSINHILQNVRFEVTGNSLRSPGEREVCFKVSYDNRPVSLLHFRFWDGSQVSGWGQVRDGKATIRLVGSSVDFDDLRLYTQYEYYKARKEYHVVESLWDLVVRPEYANIQNVSLVAQPGIDDQEIVLPEKTNLILETGSGIPELESLLKSSNTFIAVLESQDMQEIKELYGNDPFLLNKLQNYIEYNHPTPARGDVTAQVNTTHNGYEIRKLEVHHNYPSMRKQATEYLVTDFDRDGKLVDFNMCITDELYDTFVKQAEFGNDWGNRQEIIKFIEKYRTAYHTRDIETIGLMFADEALILVGRKIKKHSQASNEINYTQLPGQPGFEQIQLTKAKYLSNQKEVFDYQKDIFIDFSTFEIIKKNNAEGIYGVEMRQNYSSTTYADEGYLFLLIDFNENDPLIYIRAWQPNEWDTNALVNTSNFRIYK
nr:hypothetical protein [Bacteroidota bacterium]